jgi:hypothetical protein
VRFPVWEGPFFGRRLEIMRRLVMDINAQANSHCSRPRIRDLWRGDTIISNLFLCRHVIQVTNPRQFSALRLGLGFGFRLGFKGSNATSKRESLHSVATPPTPPERLKLLNTFLVSQSESFKSKPTRSHNAAPREPITISICSTSSTSS